MYNKFINLLFALVIIFNISIAAIGKPTGVAGISYEKHIDIIWNQNPEPELAGYKLYKWDGSKFILFSIIAEKRQWFTAWYGTTGKQGIFKLSAYDINNNESDLSDSVVTLTRDMNDEEFLEMVQRATFRYFYDYGHPTSGLARERLNSGNTVTTGGSGFGIMGLLVGIERNYITRKQGVDRMNKILNFLLTKAQRYHGAFAHWINGESGATIPFSTYDDGGDLVETSFLIQGLLTARQYFDGNDTSEIKIRDQINTIWQGVEWTWYRRASFSTYLYWHWSPNYAFQINMKLMGWSETMIAYLLAIASPTYKVNASMYNQGWASSPSYVNGNTFYGYKLFVGSNYGGPLFFTHYSFLGFDPRAKRDHYANYFLNNRNQTLINRAYCIANPKGFAGYNTNSWGLTASDDPWGYLAHEPNSGTDNGTITPSAALSSTPYTPTESIEAIKYFYRTYGSSLWGQYGFKDAFNLSQNWYASSYLAIDQGPIIVMIENYRSQLLWNKFMSAPEISSMVDSIFVPDSATSINDHKIAPSDFAIIGNYPNPFNPTTNIVFSLPEKSKVVVSIYNSLGQNIRDLLSGEMEKGNNTIAWNGKDNYGNVCPSGIYFIQIKNKMNILVHKAILQK